VRRYLLVGGLEHEQVFERAAVLGLGSVIVLSLRPLNCCAVEGDEVSNYARAVRGGAGE